MMRNKLIYIVLIAGCLLLGGSIGNSAENDTDAGANSYKSSINGICFNDANGNSRKDPGEKGIAAITVTYKAFLSGSGTGTTQTNAGGKYEFQNLRSGIYLVEAKAPKGFKHTGLAVQVVYAFGKGTANFGFKAKKVTTTTTTAAVSTTTTAEQSSTTTSALETTTTTTSGGGVTTTTSVPTTTTTEPMTLIKLISFKATPGNKCVKLEWETESEIDNVGFNIYSAESEFGAYKKLNAELIAAKGSVTSGAAYDLTDAGLENRKTYFYKLEDIDVQGESTLYGPVSATPLFMYGISK